MAPTERQWADGPNELIPLSIMGYEPGQKLKPCHEMMAEMLIVHNALIRGINSIYVQCVNVQDRSPESIPDFVEYIRMWILTIHEHHGGEETIVFPRIEKMVGVPGLMNVNVEQHEAFHDGLEVLSNYIQAIKSDEEKYDGTRIRSIIDSFMPVLRQHLYDEIATLHDLDKYEDKCDWDQEMKQLKKEIVANLGSEAMYTTFPLCLHVHDKSFGAGRLPSWPPIPWVAQVLIVWWYGRRHSNWWRFAPCDAYSVRRELPFAD